MKSLNEIIPKMVEAGESDETIKSFIDTYKAQSQPKDDRSWLSKIVTPEGHGEITDTESLKLIKEAPERIPREMMDAPESYGEAWQQTEGLGRPVLEGGGQLGGEILGGLAGTALSPGAGTVAGTIGGGSGGFALGSQLADLLYGTDKADLGKDLLLGGATSGIGQAIGPAIKWAGGKIIPKLSAGNELVDAVKFGIGDARENLFADRNLFDFLKDIEAKKKLQFPEIPKEAMELANEIGVKPMLGQTDELAIVANRAINSMDEQGIKPYLSQLKLNTEALKESLKGRMPEAKADKLVEYVKGVQERIQSGVDIPKEELAKMASVVSGAEQSDKLAGKFVDILQSAKDAEKDRVGKVWNSLGNVDIDSGPLKENLIRLVSTLQDEGKFKVLPEDFVKEMLKTEGPLPLAKLRGWASTAGEYARGTGKETVAERAAKRLRSVIEESIDAGTPNTKEYQAAKKMYREYVEKFRSGQVGKALGFGAPSTDLKSMYRLYNPNDPELVDQIINALGKREGRDQIRNIALTNLKESAMKSGSLDPKPYLDWVSKNKNLLKRQGLYDQFSSYEKAASNLSDAMKNQTDFQKTLLGKIIGKNPDEIVSSLLSDSESGSKARALFEQIKDPTAKEGLKAALKDHIFKNAIKESGVPDMSTMKKLMIKYDPVIKELFTEPEEKAAMYKARKVLDMFDKIKPAGSTPTAVDLERAAAGETGGLRNMILIGNIIKKFGKAKNRELFKASLDPTYAKKLFSGLQNFNKIPNTISPISPAIREFSQ